MNILTKCKIIVKEKKSFHGTFNGKPSLSGLLKRMVVVVYSFWKGFLMIVWHQDSLIFDNTLASRKTVICITAK